MLSGHALGTAQRLSSAAAACHHSASLNSPDCKSVRSRKRQRRIPSATAELSDAQRPAPVAHRDVPEASKCPAADLLLHMLRSRTKTEGGPGEVHLVGTGPGDVELLTLRAVRLLQTADVVLYDRLVSSDILDLVHKGATMVYVGKEKGFHTRTQEDIHELLCSFAQQGCTVLRLKGGDPYIFGRGGEEVEYLQQRGIKVHCVPGISAASGISAELGIPLTHRGLATSVRFVTGHLRKESDVLPGADFILPDAPADPNTTLVVYMGLSTLPVWAKHLQAAGLSSHTPAAAIERGTTPEQRVVYAPLHALSSEVERHGLKSPTLVVVGPVVALSPGWAAMQAVGESLREGRWVASGTGLADLQGLQAQRQQQLRCV